MLSLHVICSNSCPHTSSSVYTSSLCFLYLVSLLIIKADYMVFYTYFVLQYYCLNNAYIFFFFFYLCCITRLSRSLQFPCAYILFLVPYTLSITLVYVSYLYIPLLIYTLSFLRVFFFFRLSDRIWLNRTRTNNPFTRG